MFNVGDEHQARERVHRPPALVLPAICVPGDVDDRDSPPAKISVVRCPLICEQGPSAPSSPTSPDPRLKRPRPLTVDAMQRINLLSTSYDFGKLSPVSPNYATSDLGSSPRSSISVTSAHLGPWTAFRDQHKSSFDLDDGSSDVCSKDLLSPGMMLSPAPYSPFSDTDRPETPFSSFGRSPNLSPHVSTKSLNHFSFDLRSSSSMSNRHHHHHHHHDHQLHLLVPGGSLDQLARERSRSDSDMTPSNDQMDTSVHSTISVPAASSSSSSSYKKLLMKKYHDDNQESRMKLMKPRSSSTPPPSATESEIDDYDLRSVSRQTSRQATIDDNHAHGDENRLLHLEGANLLAAFDETRKIEDWMKQQLAAFQAANTLYNHVVSSLIVGQQVTPATTLALSAVTPISVPQIPMAVSKQENEPMPIVQPPNQQGAQSSHQPQQHQFVCTTCGQAFAVHDRLAKHIASRHRERSATLDDASKVHRCTICAKSFGRSDMLTRHMRLHTGAKPYNCQTCGQVFSRSDHLSTHLRTHTGEKPYACPLCSYSASRRDMISRHMRTHSSSDGLPIDISAPIAQLSLRSASASPLPPHNTSQASLTSASSSHDVRQLLSVLGGSLDLKLTEEVRIGSGEKSAFRPTGATSNFLAVPLTTHSLSTPSSPTPGVRSPLLSAPLSRQSSFGLYDDQPNPC